jgi:GTPase SAR1 family protein
MKIVLEGTSSAGKTSILKEFPNDYEKISIDDIVLEKPNTCHQLFKNKYYNPYQKMIILTKCIYNKIKDKCKLKKNFIVDIVHNFGTYNIYEYLDKKTKKILVYTNIDDLTRNILSRKDYDPRSIIVFTQFAKYYVSTNKESDAIDQIDLKSLIKNLLKMKWDFTDKKSLEGFAKNILTIMGINDSEKHFIKPRYNKYDYILHTKGKKASELKDMILKNVK